MQKQNYNNKTKAKLQQQNKTTTTKQKHNNKTKAKLQQKQNYNNKSKAKLQQQNKSTTTKQKQNYNKSKTTTTNQKQNYNNKTKAKLQQNKTTKYQARTIIFLKDGNVAAASVTLTYVTYDIWYTRYVCYIIDI